MGLVGKSTLGTFFETMPVMTRLPRGMRTTWPGFRGWSEE